MPATSSRSCVIHISSLNIAFLPVIGVFPLYHRPTQPTDGDFLFWLSELVVGYTALMNFDQVYSSDSGTKISVDIIIRQ